MTRDEILAMESGVELDTLVGKELFNFKGYSSAHKFSSDSRFMELLMNEYGSSEVGLFIAPLNNNQWICGRASHIYDIRIRDDHYQDKELVVCYTPMEAICKMRLILKLCPGEAVNV